MSWVLRAFALVVTDRRWAAPLSAMALGFGLFVGVAIGPGAAGTVAGTAQVIEVPTFAALGGDAKAEPIGRRPAPSSGDAPLVAAGSGPEEPLLPPTPAVPEPSEPPPAADPAPAPAPAPPSSEAGVEEEEETVEVKGVVVHANLAAGSYALAIKGGELVPVHARRLPPPGAKLSVVARRLANGTFAETEAPERSGRTGQASFSGVVSFVDPDPAAPAYTLSGRGASLLVHVAPDPTGAVPPLPILGSYATVTAGIERPPGSESTATILTQRRIEVEAGEPSAYLDLAGTVTAVLPETSRLLLSADDSGESGVDLTLVVPAAIDAARLRPGESVLATATVGADGSLTLAGIVSDERVKGADDATTAQGDLRR